MTKKPFDKSKRIKILIVLAVVIVIIICWLISVKMYFTPITEEKTSFTPKEHDFILDYFSIKSKTAKVEKMLYSQVREPIFTFYLTGLNDEDLKPFNLSTNSRNLRVEVIEFKGKELRCYFDEVDGKRILIFSLHLFDEVLYDIVK